MKSLLFNAAYWVSFWAVFSMFNPAAAQSGLFDSNEVLHIKLSGSFSNLLGNRDGVSENFPFVLSCPNSDSSTLEIPVEVKTRGHFRKMSANCDYPPLLIQFPKDGPQASSIFSEQYKLKLVMPCASDEYLIREWLVYELYNLITPKSFRARLVRVTLDDERSKKKMPPFYGILLEEEKQVAKRNAMVAVDRKLQPNQVAQESFLNMAVFEYLIANTDWSIQYLQNIKLLAQDSLGVPFAVPYDFDHAGMENAPYARPTEELLMKSVRERRYRGYCMDDLKFFEPVIALYNQLKPQIYALFADCTLLDAKYKKSNAQFLDDFYTAINTPKIWQKDFGYPCNKNGTGHIVIKGLRED
jgi:hypothetical protein